MPLFLFGTELNSKNVSLNEGRQAFKNGLKEGFLQDRTINFNKALTIFKNLENSCLYSPSSQLEGAIGDSYLQLEEYPLAILYYYRALQKEPNNPLLQNHLKEAQKNLGLPKEFKPSKIEHFFSFGNVLQISTQYKLFFYLFLITIFLISIFIWYPLKKISFLVYLTGLCASFLFINLMLFHYLVPINGIIIESAGLYRTASLSGSQLDYTPLLKGSKVNIIKSEKEGTWLKIYDPNGVVGYVLASKVRII